MHTELRQLLLLSIFFIPFLGFTQSVNCPQCASGICEGESLADYVSFSGYTFPIEINSVSGAASGSGTNIFNYTFVGGSSTISLNFTEGNGTVHDVDFPVNVLEVNPVINYGSGGSCGLINFNGSSSTASGGIVGYQWSIFQITGALNTLVTTLSGVNPSYTFLSGGAYEVCLTIIGASGCESETCEEINVGNVNPQLIFQGSGQNLSQDATGLVVPYCNSSSQPFNLLVSDDSDLNGVNIVEYTVIVDGSIVFSGGNLPDLTNIYDAVAGTVGYIQVDIVLIDNAGCSYTTSYQVYIGNFSTPSFSSQLATISLGCPEQELIIQNNNNPDNPNGSDYTLNILCGGDSTIVGEWGWEQTIPEDNLTWTPPFSSCLCDDGEFYFSTSAVHPCMTTPQLASSNFQVALPPEAEFTRTPEGNICFGEEVTYEWLFGSSLDYPNSWAWCDPDPEWSITNPSGTTQIVGFDPILTYDFPTPGVYNVCLNVYSDCGVPNTCESICVNPPISNVTLNPVWNIPALLCPDDDFTSTLSYNNLDFCDTPEIEWELYYEGALIETFDGLQADIVDLQKGEYELIVRFILEDCGVIEESTTFEVVAPPIITPEVTGPFTNACEDDEICLDDWFCIDDCGDPLTEFELVIYEGFLSDCDDSPSGAVVETITNILPNPPYNNCDPTTECTYPWIAVPGQYTLWIKAENDCGPDFECITIDIPFPNIPVLSGNDEACLGETVNINSNLPGGDFTFTSCPGNCPDEGNGPGEYTVSGQAFSWDTQEGINEPGDYILSYGGDCIGTGEITITVHPLPEFIIESSIPNAVCEGDLVQLDIDYLGPNTLDYCEWYDDGQLISGSDCSVEVDPNPGLNTYTVIVFDENGCSSQETISIEELTQPFSADCSILQASYCNNTGAVIDLTELLNPYPNNGNLTWTLNGNPITGTTIDLDGFSDGTYTIEWTWLHPQPPNCEFSGECSFEISPPVVPTISGNDAYCLGETVTVNISNSNGISGDWSFASCPGACPNDAGTAPFVFSWNTDETDIPGVYTIEYGGDCLETQSFTFTLHDLPDFDIIALPGEDICGDEDVELDINYNGNNSVAECFWINENTGSSVSPPDCDITVSPTDATTVYSVIVTDQNGCESEDQVEINIQEQPFNFDCSSIEPAYCDNESIIIDLEDLVDIDPGSVDFEWQLNGDPVVGTTIDVESLNAADSPFILTYVYTAPLAPNCVFEGQCSFNITDLTLPTLTNNGPVCAGGELTVLLSGNNGLVGEWEFQSCPGDCPTDTVLTASTLTWQTDENTEPGDYVLVYSGDCLEDATTTLTVNENPEIEISPGPEILICEGDEVDITLDYNGQSTLDCNWLNLTTGTTIADDDCSIVTGISENTETIEVTVTDLSGCSAKDTVEVSIQTQPFQFTCPDITSYCDNEDVQIVFSDLVDIDPLSDDFSWFLNGVEITDSFLDLEPLDPDGSPYELTYNYTHPDGPNCNFSGSCIFTISALTQPLISNNGPICLGEEISVEISQNNGFFGSWDLTDCPGTCPDDFNTDDTEFTWLSDDLDTPGMYFIEYSGNCLETVVDSFLVNPLPDFEITTDPLATVCSADTLFLGVNNLGITDLSGCEWFDQNGTSISSTCEIEVIPQAAAEIYFIEVQDLNGCAAIDSVELNIQQQPFSFDCSTIQSSYCDNEEVIIELFDLVGTDPETDFQWFLNGVEISGPELDIEALNPSPDPYVLSYEYLHPDPPNCLFSDSCSFTISDLTLPTVTGTDAICINDSVSLFSDDLNGFEGDWTFILCPNDDCPDNFSSSPDSLFWPTDNSLNSSGFYTVQYTGVCLDTALFDIEINPLPSFNIITEPGSTVCAEDTIEISFQNLGQSPIENCLLFTADGDEIQESGDCEYTLLPADLAGPYFIEITDSLGCVNEDQFDIDVQEQPFNFECSLEDTYCDNSTDIIDLDAQISPFPVNGTLDWFLNGALINDSELDIFNLSPGFYLLSYVYEHGDAPFCTFSDTCSFTVTELVRPSLSGELAYCQGEIVQLEADSLEGFTGEWINVFCPEPPCLPDGTDPNTFIWNSQDAPVGEYVFEYQGLCLQTETISIQILGVPEVAWTPEDPTPCLNECFEFEAELIANEDNFGWDYQTVSDTSFINGNIICFDDIGNPESLNICLWAESYHVVQDTLFTCYVSDCEEINPVFSPAAEPELPTQACPGEVLEIGVNYNEYDDCTFTLNGTVYVDCEDILIPDGPYGTFSYILELGYSGCVDSLFGEVFIPEPPSAELSTNYDPCIGDVFTELIDLQGDALNFNWGIEDNINLNYDYLLTDGTQELPVPNPIPLGDTNFQTDTTFYVNVSIGNFCESIFLEDTINLIAPPSIEIDIANTSGDVFCLPQDISFEIGEFATAYIDSVHWDFETLYDYGISDTTYTNLQFPPSVVFQNNGQTDTVNVYVTAYNQCGIDQDTLSFVLIPPNVYLEMPDFSPGLCAGEEIVIPTSIVEGDPFLGCSVTAVPNIPGFTYNCDPDLNSVTISIPPSTPAGQYEIATTIEGCGTSTDFTQIEIFPDPEVSFDVVDQACTLDTISFDNQTVGASEFEWNFGDPESGTNESFLSFPEHFYELPGIYEVTLTATSDSGCVGQAVQQVEIFGPDPTIDIDSAIVCSGSPVTTGFVNQDDLLSLQWEFLLPGIDTLIFVEESGIENTFYNETQDVQIWQVNLVLEDIYGCTAEANEQIFVLPQPVAFFTHSDLDGCAQGVEVQFNNQSTQGVSNRWVFDDPGSGPLNFSFNRNPTHVFSGPGEYYVNLYVENSFGCKSAFTRRLGCTRLLIYVPNAFTPDGNRLNEVFKPVIYGIDDIDFTVNNYYTFTIFNRWGDIVFQTNDPHEGWLGDSPNDDYYAQSEVYIWTVNIEFPEGAQEYTGHVTLVR